MDLTKANCEGEDTNIFFSDDNGHHDPENLKQARAFCKGCEIRFDCLQYAIDEKIVDGVWGGLLWSERRKLGKNFVITPADKPKRQYKQSKLRIVSEESKKAFADNNRLKIETTKDRYVEELQAALDLFGDSVNEETRTMALIKIENPDLSLAQIGASMDPPLHKDIAAGRLRRLMQSARTLTKER
jgi:WhiB family redox-sensing transcriptional regulator